MTNTMDSKDCFMFTQGKEEEDTGGGKERGGGGERGGKEREGRKDGKLSRKKEGGKEVKA